MLQQKILLIEDEIAIADAVSFTLQQEGFCVRHHTLGNEGLADFHHNGADLLILDVGLPDISGLAICREIRAGSNTPIIFLTARNDEVDRIMGLELGGDDYVAKPFSPRELVARVRAVLRRTVDIEAPAETSALNATSGIPSLFTIDTTRNVIVYAGSELLLTRHEYLVLLVLLSQPGRIFSRTQIMEQAWEYPETSLERAVDTHIKSLRAKLRAVQPDLDPIITRRGFGYALRTVRA